MTPKPTRDASGVPICSRSCEAYAVEDCIGTCRITRCVGVAEGFCLPVLTADYAELAKLRAKAAEMQQDHEAMNAIRGGVDFGWVGDCYTVGIGTTEICEQQSREDIAVSILEVAKRAKGDTK